METQSEVQIEKRNVAAQPCVLIRAKKTSAELPAFFGESYGKLYGYAGRRTRPGACFARYHDWTGDLFDLEAGVVTHDTLPGEGEIQPGQFGGHEALFTLFVGPYSQIEPVYTAMQSYLKEHGLESGGAPYEVYLNSPDQVPESELRTEVYWPVK